MLCVKGFIFVNSSMSDLISCCSIWNALSFKWKDLFIENSYISDLISCCNMVQNVKNLHMKEFILFFLKIMYMNNTQIYLPVLQFLFLHNNWDNVNFSPLPPPSIVTLNKNIPLNLNLFLMSYCDLGNIVEFV